PEHEPFHFSIVAAAPVGPGQERPTDFDLALPLVVPVEPRRPNHPAVFGIDGEQRPAGRQGVTKKRLEHLGLIAIVARMLLPDERVGCYRVKGRSILRPQRPKLEEFAFQSRLEIEGHACQVPPFLRGLTTLTHAGFASGRRARITAATHQTDSPLRSGAATRQADVARWERSASNWRISSSSCSSSRFQRVWSQ